MRYVLFFLLFCFPTPSVADTNTSATSALYFAKKEQWNEALVHARHADGLTQKLILWMYNRSPGSDAPFERIETFLRDNPDWPDQKALRARAEYMLLKHTSDSSSVIQFFAGGPPTTGAGKLALARARAAKGAPDAALMRAGWRDADMDESTEQQILLQHGSQLRETDHAARISRLLWEEKRAAAVRLIPLVGQDYQLLFAARMALMDNNKNAEILAKQLSTTLHNDVGLMYNLMRWHDKNGNKEKTKKLLLLAPKEVPSPDKWWSVRQRYIRNALETGDWKQASRLLSNHGQAEGKNLAEALWLYGWISLEYEKDTHKAYRQFYALFNKMKYPVSKARAAYWAARAAEINGNRDIARNWFTQAAKFPTTFYGQLAATRLHPGKPLALPARVHLSAAEKKAYKQRELPRVVLLLDRLGENELAHKFTQALVDNATTPKQAALAAWLGSSAGHMEDGVKAAKRALQNNILVLEAGFPRPPLPKDIRVEPALAFAITRQESEFDPRALSPSGALGLMQLLPSTAQETARKNGMTFSRDRLNEASYNLTLGTAYLRTLIDRFDGSYLLAIASYNAGPRRVREWMQEIGNPGKTPEEALRWIEKIPYEETRTYVQRVMENIQVYRQLLAEPDAIPLTIAEDLVR